MRHIPRQHGRGKKSVDHHAAFTYRTSMSRRLRASEAVQHAYPWPAIGFCTFAFPLVQHGNDWLKTESAWTIHVESMLMFITQSFHPIQRQAIPQTTNIADWMKYYRTIRCGQNVGRFHSPSSSFIYRVLIHMIAWQILRKIQVLLSCIEYH